MPILRCAFSGLTGNQLCLGKVSCLILWGVERTWSYSSVESTLVPWRIKQLDCLDNSTLPLFPMSPVISLLFHMQAFMNQQFNVKCIYQKMNIERSLQNKTDKGKTVFFFEISLEMNLY